MFSGRERDEIKMMAMAVDLFYTHWMLRAKYTARYGIKFNLVILINL